MSDQALQLTGFILDARCRECSGEGVVENPIVTRWWTELEAYVLGSGAERSVAIGSFERLVGECPGPGEMGCGECDGRGFVLTPTGSALLAFIRRYA